MYNLTEQFLDEPISETEIKKAIDELSLGKSPGPDALITAFYKTFMHEIAPLLHGVICKCYQVNALLAFCELMQSSSMKPMTRQNFATHETIDRLHWLM